MDDDIPDVVKKCLDVLDENLDIISNIELDLDDEKNDDLVPNMSLHNLYDMTEDVAESEKIKRAESKLIEDNLKILSDFVNYVDVSFLKIVLLFFYFVV